MTQLNVTLRVSIPPLYVTAGVIGQRIAFALGPGQQDSMLVLEQDAAQTLRLVAGTDTVETATDARTGVSSVRKARWSPEYAWATHVLVAFAWRPAGFPPPAGVRDRDRKVERELLRLENRGVAAARAFYRSARAHSGQVRAGWSGSLVLPVWLAITRPTGEVVMQRSFDPIEVLTGPDEALDMDAILAASALEARDSPRVLERSILGDARYVSLYDLRYAILLAAIALEVSYKRIVLDPTRRNHPDVQAAFDACQRSVHWFHRPAKLALGHSLRTDHRDVYNHVGNLFSERNQVAHHGAPIQLNPTRAERLIRAADTATRWLDHLDEHR